MRRIIGTLQEDIPTLMRTSHTILRGRKVCREDQNMHCIDINSNRM